MKARGWEIIERVKAGETLVFDGGYGTMLFAAGLANGACPELWNDTHADIVRGIHRAYYEAGSDIVETNTFGGTRLKLNEYKIGDRTRALNVQGARLARSVAPGQGYVAGSIGPTSRLPRGGTGRRWPAPRTPRQPRRGWTATITPPGSRPPPRASGVPTRSTRRLAGSALTWSRRTSSRR